MAQTQEQLISVFDKLINQHQVLIRESNLASTQWAQLKSLLHNYVERSRQREESEQRAIPANKLRFNQLLLGAIYSRP
jgi:hypothetical protein